jgi:hypothetical protein
MALDPTVFGLRRNATPHGSARTTSGVARLLDRQIRQNQARIQRNGIYAQLHAAVLLELFHELLPEIPVAYGFGILSSSSLSETAPSPGYCEDILDSSNRVSLILGLSDDEFQIPNQRDLQPSLGLNVNGQTAYLSDKLRRAHAGS